ncbi:hypothetical protein H2198_005304 [Neophaeococcomyces mojaviensis]|uniref:Uncharacterized protein n=1 Tax=Neophaeococcomyces mojaviensis TaxID=3383035 RepID=A0ACC3A6A6_9EURO|nr:hypothetical protein H2198_005304 [Knufia sp. JES_112]
MTEVLVQQVNNMESSKATETSSSFSLLGNLFASRPSRLHGTMGSIYVGMCEELKPDESHLPSESWNASVDSQPQQQRLRSYSDMSAASTENTASNILKSPVFDIPRWTWPEHKAATLPTTPISKPLEPTKKA